LFFSEENYSAILSIVWLYYGCPIAGTFRIHYFIGKCASFRERGEKHLDFVQFFLYQSLAVFQRNTKSESTAQEVTVPVLRRAWFAFFADFFYNGDCVRAVSEWVWTFSAPVGRYRTGILSPNECVKRSRFSFQPFSRENP
jgi:hypothetical protein